MAMILAMLGVPTILAAFIAWATAHYIAAIAGLSAGGLTTIATVLYLWWTIRRLRNALLLAVAAVDMERRIHLRVITQVKSALEGAKTNRHRFHLLTNLEKYADEFSKEVRRGPVVKQ